MTMDPDDDALDPRSEAQIEQAMRWRLILGRFADDTLGFGRLGGECQTMGEGAHGEGGANALRGLLDEAQTLDVPLQYIYDRSHAQRAHRSVGTGDSSGLTVPMWLQKTRKLFPTEAVQVMEQDAITRYGLTELITDPEILRKAQPSEALLKAILQFKSLMKGEVLVAAKEVVRQVVADIAERMMKECMAALHGVIDPEQRPPMRTFRNTDWKKTIRRNLKNYDDVNDRLVVERVFFKHRQRKKSDWRIIVSVDQSGSMLDKLVHSAVMAAIFTTLPSVDVKLVLWDTRIVDFSDKAHDPLEVLMSCQLGGGNDDLAAMQYCASLITEPTKTIFVTVSDWYICVPAGPVLALAHQLHEAGVTCIGLSALDEDCKPVFNEQFARDLAGTGWFVAALTPKKLAEHIGRLIA